VADSRRCIARLRPKPEHQGYPGHLHGGIISTLLHPFLPLIFQGTVPNVSFHFCLPFHIGSFSLLNCEWAVANVG
jgi:hypothetical protein